MKCPLAILALLLAAALTAYAAPGDFKARKQAADDAAAQKAANAPVPKDGYSVANTFNLAGEGLWQNITVDPEGKFLYVPKQKKTAVIEIASGKSVADIPCGQGANSVALAPDAGRGFVACKDGTVTVFDLKTRKTLGSIPVGEDPGPIAYDPASKKILVCCLGKIVPLAPNLDPANPKPDASIDLQGKPDSIVVDDAGMAYLSLRDRAEIQVLDTHAMKFLPAWRLEQAHGKPAGLSIDKIHNRLFMACANRLVVLSATDGHVLADLPLHQQSTGTAFADARVFVAGSLDGVLTILAQNPDGIFEVSQSLLVKGSLHQPVANPKTGQIYVPSVDFDKGRPIPGTFKIAVLEKKVTRASCPHP